MVTFVSKPQLDKYANVGHVSWNLEGLSYLKRGVQKGTMYICIFSLEIDH